MSRIFVWFLHAATNIREMEGLKGFEAVLNEFFCTENMGIDL